MSSEDDQAVHPLSVAQLRTAQEHLVWRQRHCLFIQALHLQRPLVGVERRVGLLRPQVALEAAQRLGRGEVGGAGVTLLDFEVGLAVEVACLDIREAVWLTGRDGDHVGRQEVVALQSQDIADLDIPPWLLYKVRSIEDFGAPRIQLGV